MAPSPRTSRRRADRLNRQSSRLLLEELEGRCLPSLMFTTLDVPGSTRTAAEGINASGQIVGAYETAGFEGFPQHGFLLRHGRYTTLDVPGSVATGALGINASGQIVGEYETAGGKQHGFLLRRGSYTRLDVPGSVATAAQGINAGPPHQNGGFS